jgi:hypothetical protein
MELKRNALDASTAQLDCAASKVGDTKTIGIKLREAAAIMVEKASGGRPMRHEGYAYTDRVSGKAVHHFRDQHGRLWLAKGPYSLFRTRVPYATDYTDLS